ncbi:FtsX-like permease family protein [Nonomuraea typhae]|uniref:FtsX-like permease family protein n=1 Tax=Nonomuraea typhae TaxID=2603600 RepID=UPI0012FA3577|nr:ABC transporter permease [Nonomuraea typhae]
MSAFRAALRVARRDALRFKGRSALVILMIALPVFVFTGLLTGSETSNVSFREGLIARLGAADAQLITHDGPVQQNAAGYGAVTEPQKRVAPRSAEQIAALAEGRVIPYDNGSVSVRIGASYHTVSAMELDLRDPMTRGMRELVAGRFPAAPGEVAVSAGMAEDGVRLGDTLAVSRELRPVKVVGVLAHPFQPGLSEMVAAQPGTILFDRSDGKGAGWLLDAGRPVLWSEVEKLNRARLAVASRAVISDPPADLPYDSMFSSGRQAAVTNTVGIAAAIVMIVLETVLLAGPAFAVSLRRRRRELAVLAAQGASPYHLRAIVLADGLLLGGLAAAIGVILGLVGGAVGPSLLAPLAGNPVGPLDVPWLYVAGIALLGLASGVIAALAPAFRAARQAPAEVLAGRDDGYGARERAGKPLLGGLLIAVGLAATYLAVQTDLALLMTAAVLTVLGSVALMPWLVSRTADLAGRLPLPLRLSVRDATRHRVRTASAAAAVMAVTAMLVAVGVGAASSEAKARAEYRAPLPRGTISLAAPTMDERNWAGLRAAAAARLPGLRFVPALNARDKDGRIGRFSTAQHPLFCDGCVIPGRFFYDLRIGGADLLELFLGKKDPQAQAALAAGKAIAFGPGYVRGGHVEVVFDADSSGTTEEKPLRLPAVEARAADPVLSGVLLPPGPLTAAGYRLETRSLFAAHDVEDPIAFDEEMATLSWGVNVEAETGYTDRSSPLVYALIVAALVLVLGGTLAATGLAAADMRRDLDTMSAVGAPAATRRLVIAAQAGYITVLGSLVGLVVGLVTGVAVAWSLMDRYRYQGDWKLGPAVTGPIVIPWELLAVVVLVLPLIAASLSGLFARTRLTLARRLT